MLGLLHCLLEAEPGTLWSPRGGGAALSLSRSSDGEELLSCFLLGILVQLCGAAVGCDSQRNLAASNSREGMNYKLVGREVA